MLTRRTLKRGIAVSLSLVLLGYLLFTVDFGGIAGVVSDVPASTVAAAAMLLVVSTLAGAGRLFLILRDFGSGVSPGVAARATFLGSVGGLLFLQFVGQMITRVAILKSHGVPVPTTLISSIYERIVSTLLLGAVAGSGVAVLFGRLSMSGPASPYILAAFLASGALAALGGPVFGYRRLAVDLVGPLARERALFRLGRVFVATAVIQGAMLGAYVTLGHAVSPSVPLAELAAASAIVMFAASLPISFGGWGVRELGAVYAYGAIGIGEPQAIVVSVIVGVVSQLVLFVAAGTSAMVPAKTAASVAPEERQPQPAVQPSGPNLAERTWFWFVPVGIATLVVFQIRLPVGSSALTVNLADPLAVVGAIMLVAAWADTGFSPNAWRLKAIGILVASCTFVLCLGVFIGWLRYDYVSWAFFNRLAGWGILLGFAASGALAVVSGGTGRLAVVGRTYLVAVVAVTVVALGVRLAVSFAPVVVQSDLGERMTGFAGNPNAFSFQILVAFAVLLVLARPAPRQMRSQHLIWAAGAVLIAGLWFAASRAGFIAFGALLVTAWALSVARPRDVLVWLLLGAGLSFLIEGMMNVLPELTGDASVGGRGVARLSSLANARSVFEDSNDDVRWISLVGGLRMWLDNPVLGGGVGAFIHRRIEEFGDPLVIHNSLVWILAEMGLVGVAAFGTAAVLVTWNALVRRNRPGQRRQHDLLLLLMVVMAVHSTFHDMLYQRPFWFFMGACMAVPFAVFGAWPRPSRIAGSGRLSPEKVRSEAGETPVRTDPPRQRADQEAGEQA